MDDETLAGDLEYIATRTFGIVGDKERAETFRLAATRLRALNAALAMLREQLENQASIIRDSCTPVNVREERMLRELSSLRERLEYIRGLGEVYSYPSEWNCMKEGGHPPIDAYQRIDLAEVASINEEA
jgi:hypothetical protein